MSIVSDIFAGGVSGVLSGVGTLARDLRAAITGEEAITGEAKGKLLSMAAQLEHDLTMAEFEIQKAQIEVNKIDAASTSLFKSGWRPLSGWGAAFSVVVYPIIRALLPWFIQVGALALGKDPSLIPTLPPLETTEMMAVLGALLGFGGFRSFEKAKGKV